MFMIFLHKMLSEEQIQHYGEMLRHAGDEILQREQRKGSNELFYLILLFALFIVWLIFRIENFLG